MFLFNYLDVLNGIHAACPRSISMDVVCPEVHKQPLKPLSQPTASRPGGAASLTDPGPGGLHSPSTSTGVAELAFFGFCNNSDPNRDFGTATEIAAHVRENRTGSGTLNKKAPIPGRKAAWTRRWEGTDFEHRFPSTGVVPELIKIGRRDYIPGARRMAQSKN